MRFTTPEIENEMNNNVIIVLFPNLAMYDRTLLLKYFTRLIDVIAYSFGFYHESKVQNFLKQLRQNNYRDATGILYLLLPYINADTSDSFAYKSEIKTLNDIYLAKYEDVDVNIDEPKYKFSNLQYGRCQRPTNSKDSIKEINFNKDHLEHNFYLLCDTIRQVSYKLYTNWINIVPYTGKDIEYTNTTFLKNTNKYMGSHTNPENKYEYISNLKNYKFEDINFDPVIDIKFSNIDDSELLNKLNRLQIDEIYDIITNDLYYAVKDIKWLIYEIPILASVPRIPIHSLFVTYFGLLYDSAAKNISWEELTDNERRDFDVSWKKMVITAVNNQPLKTEQFNIPSDTFQNIMINIILFFNNHYTKVKSAIRSREYISINKIINTDQIDDDMQVSDKIIFRNVSKNIQSVHSKHIYEFIKETLQQFNDTYYGVNERNSDPNVQRFYNPKVGGEITILHVKINDIDVARSLKNLYNFAKSFCHYTDTNNKFTSLPRFWKSLDTKTKNMVFDRLIDKETKWFNISGYLKKYHNIQDNAQITVSTNNIRTTILDRLNYIITITLAAKGVFTNFEFNLDLTDTKIIPEDKRRAQWPQKLGKKIFCRQTQEEIGIANQKNPTKNTCNDYEDTIYFLNGIQYSKMNHFNFKIDKNNKKELLENQSYFQFNSNDGWYAAYALDWISQIGFFHKYLNNRIIYVTGSTGVGKSTQIPKLLVYALKAIDCKNKGTIACTQPRIAPVTNNAAQVSLELGVPIRLVQANDDDKKDKKDKKDKNVKKDTNLNNYSVQYKTKGNKHDKQMPKLVIQFVTDGLLNQVISHPLLKIKTIIKDEVTKKEIENIYRQENIYDIVIVDEAHEHNANMDHILTYMKYVSYYNNSMKLVIISATMADDEPNYRRYYRNINDNKMYPLNSMIADNKLDRINVDRRLDISPPGRTTSFPIKEYYVPGKNPIDTIIDVIKIDAISNTSDVLYFQPGIAEIDKAVDELNERLPPYAIAIPYHGQMKKDGRDVRKFVDDIAENKSLIRIKHDEDFIETPDLTVGSMQYNKVVIVATNVAEASITISTLKYVMETGSQKTSEYDYKKKMSTLKATDISESSRIQRKGRVGRKMAGIVYYFYEEGKMKNNKVRYSASIQDVSDEIYYRLKDNNDEVMFTSSNDPNKPRDDLSLLLFPESIRGVLLDQYFVMNKYYTYVGNDAHYDYINHVSPNDIYDSGFTLKTLVDSDGSHYIIHPEELSIKRNLIGKITGLKLNADVSRLSYADNKVISFKMISFINDLKAYLFLVGDPVDNIYTSTDAIIIKTNISKYLFQYKLALEMENRSQYIAYLYSRVFQCEEHIIRFIAMAQTISVKFSNSIFITETINGKYINKIDKHMSKTNSSNPIYNSDIMYMLSVINELHIMMTERGILNFTDEFVFPPKILQIQTNVDEVRYNYYNKEKEEQSREEIILFSDIKDNWCKIRYIKPEFIDKYFDIYIKLKMRIYCIEKDIYEDELPFVPQGLVDDLRSIVNINPSNIKERITLSLLMGYPYNIIYNVIKTPYYIQIYNPILSNVYKISTIGPVKLDSIVSSQYIKRYMLYINIDGDKNQVSMLHYVKPEYLKAISNIYSVSYIKNTYNHLLTSKLNISTIDPILGSHVLATYYEILREIKTDLLTYYDPTAQLGLTHIIDPKYKRFPYDNREKDIELLQTAGSRKKHKLIQNIDMDLMYYFVTNNI
jgi:hypothetical protein